MKVHFLGIYKGLVVVLLLCFGNFASAQSVVRGPYLQQMSESSTIVRWRTNTQTDAVVRYGIDQNNLNLTAGSGASGFDHEVEVSGLIPQTVYYYSVGNTSSTLAGDNSYYFETAPVDGQNTATKIWVVGDSGTANSNAQMVRDAFIQYTNNDLADMMLMLGDNAYTNGTDEEYQVAMFDMYPNILRRLPVWSTLGNHDGISADSATQSGPYYDMFTLPDNAQLGGVASGTEAYYSFERANIHFVVLNSFDVDRSTQSPMLTWLENDLGANTKQWIIAMWHHPPYSHGTHNSDLEQDLIDMRTNALPILESYGVDLVLSGHSHAYERSFLIDGHHGDSTTLQSFHIIDGGDGNESGTGAYQKPDTVATPNEGAVYAVAGSSGLTGGGLLDHPIMVISLNTLGSMILDIEGPRLDAVFIDSTAQPQDAFTIVKGTVTDTTPPQVIGAAALGATEILVSFSEALAPIGAENASNYSGAPGLNVLSAVYSPLNRSVTLTTTSLIQSLEYTLTINNVSDTNGNVISGDTTTSVIFTNNSEKMFIQGQLPTPAYAGNTDTYISSNLPNTNFGNAPVLLLDGDDPPTTGNDLATLLRYDVSSLPANTTVSSVRILFNIVNPSTNSYEVYPLLKSWDESGVTWNESSFGTPWQIAGAQGAEDRGAQVIAVLSTPPVTSSYSLDFNQQGVDLVQAWIDGSVENFGVIIGNTTRGDGVDILSSEDATWQNRPVLVVVLSTPADLDGDSIDDATDNCPLTANSLQIDTDSDGYGNHCDGDFNNDCVVNFIDFQQMTEFFLSSEQLYDLNGDNLINFIDLAAFAPMFLSPPGPSTLGNCP